MQESYQKGVANHLSPESCLDGPRGRGEALTGGSTGGLLSSDRMIQITWIEPKIFTFSPLGEVGHLFSASVAAADRVCCRLLLIVSRLESFGRLVDRLMVLAISP